jgi:carbon-monoxide dehydrogenase large subunit
LLAAQWGVLEEEIGFSAGVFCLGDTNRTLCVADIASSFPGALDGESRGILAHRSCANGCHACEVEIDPETGEVHILAYTAADDFATVVNPAAVHGQVLGGVAQGLGQALMEYVAYPATGQSLSGSLMDYAMPRAQDVPNVTWIDNGLVSRTNLFGAKACAEAGASAAPPAVMNAGSRASYRARCGEPNIWQCQPCLLRVGSYGITARSGRRVAKLQRAVSQVHRLTACI